MNESNRNREISEIRGSEARLPRRERTMERFGENGGASPSLWLGGLAVLGLGALAFYYFGPDFKRYMKIRHM